MLHNSNHPISIQQLDREHEQGLRVDARLRSRVANSIGASLLKAVIFSTSFLQALSRRGNLYLAKRDDQVVGAAYMKFIHRQLMGELLERQNWAVLYGIDAENETIFRSLLQYVLDVNAQQGIKRLYIGNGLRRNVVAALKASVVHRETKILHGLDLELCFDNGPQEFSFLK